MTTEKYSHRLFFVLFFVYTMSCFGKIAFPAVTAALIDEAVLTKTQAGTIGAVFWVLYAIGQFIGGALANKYRPTLLLGIGMVGGAVCNFLMAVCVGYIPMLLIWSFNGLIQFGVWPSILRMVTNNILPEQRSKTLNYLAYCYAIGSILSYLTNAAVLSILPWNYLFICCGVMNLVCVIPLIRAERVLIPQLEPAAAATPAAKKASAPLPRGFIWSSGLVLLCFLIVLRNLFETGIKSWTPTILMETFGATPQYTSLLSVVMLAMNLTGVTLCAWIYRKVKKSEPAALLVVFLTAVPLLLVMLGYRSMNILVVTLVLSLVTILSYGSGQIMSMYYPARFQNLGATPFIGGVINCFAALGNVLSSYVNGALADSFGWDVIIWSWNGLIVAMVAVSLVLLAMWKRICAYAEQA
ncbi:MAG: MFS transporter [Ruminococcaceae bacterium]|nr:MFS transporter [Oscillospiraceae bacterium]